VSARREEEAMSMHIVDDEQRSDHRATPMRPSGSGLEGASASLALLDDVHRHRLRRAALHLPLPSQERGPFQFSGRLLVVDKRISETDPLPRFSIICVKPILVIKYSFTVIFYTPPAIQDVALDHLEHAADISKLRRSGLK
jgi:hypothetical protein